MKREARNAPLADQCASKRKALAKRKALPAQLSKSSLGAAFGPSCLPKTSPWGGKAEQLFPRGWT